MPHHLDKQLINTPYQQPNTAIINFGAVLSQEELSWLNQKGFEQVTQMSFLDVVNSYKLIVVYSAFRGNITPVINSSYQSLNHLLQTLSSKEFTVTVSDQSVGCSVSDKDKFDTVIFVRR